MKVRRKQILFLICVAALLVGVLLFFLLKDNDDSQLSEFHETDRKDTVVYNGKEYQYNEHLSNFVFMGIDTREPITEYETIEEVGRADAIFFLSYDRVKKTLKCISIPRDTMADVRMIAPDGTDMGTSKEHINMQYVFGDGKDESCRLMKETISSLLYDVPIQGYCALNMDGIAVAVDVLGGVDMVLSDDSLVAVNENYVKGAQMHITKENAEKIIRYRDTNEAQSAIVRTNRQKELMKVVSEHAREKSAEDPDFIVDMYDSLQPYIVSNIGNDILAKLLEAKFDSATGVIDLPGQAVEGEMHDEYHLDEMKVYELVLQMFYEEL